MAKVVGGARGWAWAIFLAMACSSPTWGQGQGPPSAPWPPGPVGPRSDCPAGVDPTYCALAAATGGSVVVCDFRAPGGTDDCARAAWAARRSAEAARPAGELASRGAGEGLWRALRGGGAGFLAAWLALCAPALAWWGLSAVRHPGARLERDALAAAWAGAGCALAWWSQGLAGLVEARPAWALCMLFPAGCAYGASRMLSRPAAKAGGIARAAALAAGLAAATLGGALAWVAVAVAMIH